MAHIEIAPTNTVWVVRTTDGVLVESRNALALTEGGRGPVIYFPRDDIAMALLEASDTTTRCPHKGTASYFDYVGPDGRIKDVAWSYESPDQDAANPIAGHLAFYDGKVTVEEL